jgi:hypothetical protein
MIRRKITLICSLFILGLLAGCTVKQDSGITESWELEGLTLTISSPRMFYENGETVLINILLENNTSETILLTNNETDTDYVFDILVDDIYLSSIYSELAVHKLQLEPGEQVEIEYAYTPPANARSVSVNAYTVINNGVTKIRSPLQIFYGERLDY